MKKHVFRPVWVALAVIGLVFAARAILVPEDFGVHGKNFTYGYHRLSNIAEWSEVPIKYLGKEYCADCHEKTFSEQQQSKHSILQCENCHGPAVNHPEDPELLTIDRSRELCLRCHALLIYPTSNRALLPGVDPEDHNTDSLCSDCHNPHNPSLEEMS